MNGGARWLVLARVWLSTIVAVLLLGFGGEHLAAAMGWNWGLSRFIHDGRVTNLLEAFAHLAGSVFVLLSIPKRTTRPVVPSDPIINRAIRERAVDNLIEVQREIHRGHA